jgi:putative DNA modification/repair radical SAM protein
MDDRLAKKLEILADAAKYDASCASSGGVKRHSQGKPAGIGSVTGSGICHAYAPDGRCISLLKILLTNNCIFDCAYCINRRSSNVRRARFTVAEVVKLTIGFYKRNYIEGLFLSSGIIRDSDYTMEQIIAVARSLRDEHQFRGYIHLKAIPDAAPELIAEAGRYADRLSINIELPKDDSIARLAPEKQGSEIRKSMGALRARIEEAREEKAKRRHPLPLLVSGQSTQMIVGADEARDADILATSASLYDRYRLKRVYYSAFSPIPDASRRLPLAPAPLMREHRIYQADWMLRHYGFSLPEVQSAAPGGMLDLAIDPKLSWALLNRHVFPLDINRADREMLLRVPGLGPRAVDRIVASRRWRRLRLEDLARLSRRVSKMRPFILAEDWRPGALTDNAALRDRLAPPPRQLDLFA